ncbi:hypothetical protein T308_02290 [Streptococcus pneumoniae A026]|nr:hypothetical protein T308_02290 [Streptococcus pneumoniae A026]CIV67886.1 Uncharacterised protein [Streptococcus pneumoniae]CIV86717.1 Uncharacterised protein [Streptococcus pneumoniae]
MIVGVAINGISIIGFKTVGNVNRIAVLILKIDGIIASLPNVLFARLLLNRKRQIARPIVAPPPPINTNKSLNGNVIMCWSVCPAATASWFSVVNCNQTGSTKAFKTCPPLTPQNQKNEFTITHRIIPGSVPAINLSGVPTIAPRSPLRPPATPAASRPFKTRAHKTKVVKPGKRAENDLLTTSGTPLGIFIVIPRWINIR